MDARATSHHHIGGSSFASGVVAVAVAPLDLAVTALDDEFGVFPFGLCSGGPLGGGLGVVE